MKAKFLLALAVFSSVSCINGIAKNEQAQHAKQEALIRNSESIFKIDEEAFSYLNDVHQEIVGDELIVTGYQYINLGKSQNYDLTSYDSGDGDPIDQPKVSYTMANNINSNRMSVSASIDNLSVDYKDPEMESLRVNELNGVDGIVTINEKGEYDVLFARANEQDMWLSEMQEESVDNTGWFSDLFKKIANTIIEVVDRVTETVMEIVNEVVETVEQIVSTVVETVNVVVKKFVEAAKTFAHYVLKAFEEGLVSVIYEVLTLAVCELFACDDVFINLKNFFDKMNTDFVHNFIRDIKRLFVEFIQILPQWSVDLVVDKLLCMSRITDNSGNQVYQARQNCWQRIGGYNDVYDSVFNLFSDCDFKKFEFYDKNQDGLNDYILWAWKGDYWGLGAGAELGVYQRLNDSNHWIVADDLDLNMKMQLFHHEKEIANVGGDQRYWWITAFNPKHTMVMPQDLRVKYTVDFKGQSSKVDWDDLEQYFSDAFSNTRNSHADWRVNDRALDKRDYTFSWAADNYVTELNGTDYSTVSVDEPYYTTFKPRTSGIYTFDVKCNAETNLEVRNIATNKKLDYVQKDYLSGTNTRNYYFLHVGETYSLTTTLRDDSIPYSLGVSIKPSYFDLPSTIEPQDVTLFEAGKQYYEKQSKFNADTQYNDYWFRFSSDIATVHTFGKTNSSIEIYDLNGNYIDCQECNSYSIYNSVVEFNTEMDKAYIIRIRPASIVTSSLTIKFGIVSDYAYYNFEQNLSVGENNFGSCGATWAGFFKAPESKTYNFFTDYWTRSQYNRPCSIYVVDLESSALLDSSNSLVDSPDGIASLNVKLQQNKYYLVVIGVISGIRAFPTLCIEQINQVYSVNESGGYVNSFTFTSDKNTQKAFYKAFNEGYVIFDSISGNLGNQATTSVVICDSKNNELDYFITTQNGKEAKKVYLEEGETYYVTYSAYGYTSSSLVLKLALVYSDGSELSPKLVAASENGGYANTVTFNANVKTMETIFTPTQTGYVLLDSVIENKGTNLKTAISVKDYNGYPVNTYCEVTDNGLEKEKVYLYKGNTYRIVLTESAKVSSQRNVKLKVNYTDASLLNKVETINIPQGNRYYETVCTLGAGQSMEYYFKFANAGTKIFQTFGSLDTYMTLYDNNGNKLKFDDDKGASSNAYIMYNVAANREYKLVVRFYNSSVSGNIKTTITPIVDGYSYNKYEDIQTWNVSPNSSLALRCTRETNTSTVFLVKPTSSGTYTFDLTTVGDVYTDTYLYVVDPTSSSTLSSNAYNDDAVGQNSRVRLNLVANRLYYVVISAYTLSSSTGDIDLDVYKS